MTFAMYPGGFYPGEGFVRGAPTSNTVLSVSIGWAQDGSYSLAMTAIVAGAVGAITPMSSSGVPVIAGNPVRAMAFFHSSSPVSCTVAIDFFDVFGDLLTRVTSPAVNATTGANGTGAQAFVTVVAPSGAVTASLVLYGAGLGAGQVLNADSMLLGPGTLTSWSRGGFISNSTVTITRSDGVLVRGAGWQNTVVNLPANQSAIVVDVEAAPNTGYTYTAVVSTTVGGLALSSAVSPATASVTTNANNLFWLLDPTKPSSAVGFVMNANWQPKFHEVGQVYYPLGNPTPVKSTDGTKGLQGLIPIFTSSVAQEIAVEKLLTTTNVLLFMTPQRGVFYVVAEPSQDRMGAAPPSWEGTKVPQVAWTLAVIAAARP